MTRRTRILLGIVLGGLLLRLGLMAVRRDFLEFDETFYLLIADALSRGRGFVMNGLPQIAFPPLPALLLAALERAFGSMEVPSRIASALFGALLSVPVHRVGARWLGRRAATTAALLTAVCPSLVAFVPARTSYAERLYFGHEPLHVLLMIGALWALFGALRRPSWTTGALTGLLSALAYLTRNESILFGGAAVALLTARAARPRAEAPGALRACAVAAAVALVAAGVPYPIYLHGVTSRWSLSGKTGTAAAVGRSVEAQVRDDDTIAFEKAHYALDASGERMASTYWGWDVPRPEETLRPTIRAAASNAVLFLTVVLPVIVPWPLWPFLIVGLVAIARRRRRRRLQAAGAAVALLLLPSAAVCAFLFVEPRHHLFLVPVALLVAALGIAAVARWTKRRRAGAALSIAAASALLALALRPVLAVADPDNPRAEAALIREMGEALAAEVPESEPIMSWHPALAFRAHRDWRVLPSAKFPEIAAYAIARGTRVVVLEKSVFGPPPGRPPGEAAAFALFRLDDVTREDVESGFFRIEPGESLAGARGRLFTTYRVLPAHRWFLPGETPHFW